MSPLGGPLLPRSFFGRPAVQVAPELLGTVAVAGVGRDAIAVRITEVEAYAGPTDPASHAFRRTVRSEVMYGPPGHLYVYFIYGMHWCANVVTSQDGVASAVLLRAGEVIGGIQSAGRRRPARSGAVRRDVDLARGPSAMTQVLGLAGANSGADLCRPGRPFALRAGVPPVQIRSGPRVGVAVAGDVPWRFWDAGSPTVSAYRPGGGRRRPRRAEPPS